LRSLLLAKSFASEVSTSAILISTSALLISALQPIKQRIDCLSR